MGIISDLIKSMDLMNSRLGLVTWQASSRHFIVVCSIVFHVSQHCILHTNGDQPFGTHGTRKHDSESKFSKNVQG